MRSAVIVAFSLLLGACASRAEMREEAEANARQAADCINREAITVAPVASDLDVAAATVVARCGAYTGALRRDLTSKYPGYRDYTEPKLREADELYLAQARLAITRVRQPQ